jgi:hypothetical protein
MSLFIQNVSATNITQSSLNISNIISTTITTSTLNATNTSVSNLIATSSTSTNLMIPGTNASTNITTGALVVSGGFGLSGSFYTGPIRANGLFGLQQPYSIWSDVTITAGGSNYSATLTYTNNNLTTAFSGPGVSAVFTATKYNGSTGGSVSIDPRYNYMLAISGSGANQILSAFYLIQCGNSNTGINVTNIGSNGIFGTVAISVSANGSFTSFVTPSLAITISATSSTASQIYYFTITFTCLGFS